jgi:hypothetical protein
MHAPRISFVNTIERILRYLKGTHVKRILMKNNNYNDICGYSDSDLAESFDPESTISFLHIYRGNLAI